MQFLLRIPNSLLLLWLLMELGHAVWRIKQLEWSLSTTAEMHFHDYIDQNSDRFRTDFNLHENLFVQQETDLIESECLKLVSYSPRRYFVIFSDHSYSVKVISMLSMHFCRQDLVVREPRYPAWSSGRLPKKSRAIDQNSPKGSA